MKAYDLIKNIEIDVTTQDLINLMTEENRQIDLILHDKKTDEDGYLTWDAEHWSVVTAKKIHANLFIGR
jgi:hypothetical protein